MAEARHRRLWEDAPASPPRAVRPPTRTPAHLVHRMGLTGKQTPAWVAHRQGLSDKTPPKRLARQYDKAKAEDAFHKWHDECQKRKQRKEVLIAKKLTPKRGTSAAQRKPPSRLRCP